MMIYINFYMYLKCNMLNIYEKYLYEEMKRPMKTHI
jgi:hypothetical protein